jgi:hypothetical protein
MSVSSPAIIFRSRLFCLALFFVLTALHIGFILSRPASYLGPDGGEYYRLALEMWKSSAWLAQPVHAYWPPLWSLTLGAVFAMAGPSLLAGRLFLLLCLIVTTIGVWRLSAEIVGDAAARWGALFFYASWNTFRFTGYLQYEIFLSMLTTLAILATWLSLKSPSPRPQALLVAGFLWGFAGLTSPKVLLLVPLVGFLFLRRWKGISALLRWIYFAAGSGVPIAVWAIRNYVAFLKIILVSTNGGVNFYIGNNPQATGGFIHPSQLGVRLPYDASKEWYRAGIEYIARNPTEALERYALKLVKFCNPHYAFEYPFYVLFWVGVLLAVRHVTGTARFGLMLVFLFLVTLTTVQAAYFVDFRFRIPLEPLIYALAAYAALFWVSRLTASEPRRASPGGSAPKAN